MELRLATIRASCCLLTEQSGRSHLATCHAIDSIVNENDCDVLTTVQRMDGFCCSDTCQVAIALIGEYETVGP